MQKASLLIFITFLFCACSNDIGEVNELTKQSVSMAEVADNVKIIYSDSALVKVKIEAPKMVRHLERSQDNQEFPDGIFIEFLDEAGNARSWLEADYAIRDEDKNVFIARGNVKFFNQNKDALESTELKWHEKNQFLDTDKFVRIVQPSRGDTSYGYGFKTNQDFTVFEIKRKTSAKFNIDRLKGIK